MTYPRAPLRCMGGKHYARRHILPLIPRTGPVVSPFLGGGAIELALASEGIPVYGSDIDMRLINFFQCIQTDAAQVKSLAYSYTGGVDRLEKPQFQELKYLLSNNGVNRFEAAALFWLFNTYSMYGMNLRYGESKKRASIERITTPPTCFSVEHLDYRDALAKHHDLTAYLDPPYYGIPHYYEDVPAWEEQDHADLAAILCERTATWVLSYDSHPRVRELLITNRKTEALLI